jgi:DNA polymerase
MSLDLDPRQRAMLEEMGVKVWSPLAQAAVAKPASPETQLARAAPAASVTAAPAPRERAVATSATVPAPAPDAAAMPLRPRDAGVGAMDWATLQQAVADCRACALCNGRKHTVFGMGGLMPPSADQPPVADWLIVGEAPGEQEDLSGLPFVGPAGQLLDNMLKAMGLDRKREAAVGEGQAAQGTYIANVLKCRPPSNRNPEGDEVAQCLPYLRRQIELLQPKVILAMGRFAAQALLHDSVPDVHSLPLGKLRSRVHSYHGIPVVVTYHPAYLLRALGDKAKAWADLCLAMQTFSALTHSNPGVDRSDA